MVAGLALVLVLSSPVPLPKPVAPPPPPVSAPVLSEAGPALGGAAAGSAPGRTVAALSADQVPLPLARPTIAAVAAPEAGAGSHAEGASSDGSADDVPAAAGAGRRAETGSDAVARDGSAGELATAAADPPVAATVSPTVAGPESAAAGAVPIPLPRPGAPTATGPLAAAGEKAEALASTAGQPRPAPRPDGSAPIVRAMLARPRYAAPGDMVCRDPRISGQPAATFVGGIPGCGIADPVRVASVAGVRLSAPVTVDCRTARKFADWVTGIAQPAARETLGSNIASIRIMGSYACRPRNNSPGERLSEHSVGRAVDVGGVRLADGRRIAVLEDWGRGAPGAFLRRVWKGACGGFTTVIGPDGDRHHRDHLHLDAAYRDTTWCR